MFTMHKVPVHTYKFYLMLALGSGTLFSLTHAVVTVITESTVLMKQAPASEQKSSKRKLLCFTLCKD